MIKGTTLGTATDAEGKYQLDVPVSGNVTLAFSFVGMKPQEVTVGNAAVVDVKLESDSETLDDVVVTGYFNKSKDSFTGAVTQVKREELRKFGNVNLIEALKMVDPAFKIKENNEMGSDPNTLPIFLYVEKGALWETAMFRLLSSMGTKCLYSVSSTWIWTGSRVLPSERCFGNHFVRIESG